MTSFHCPVCDEFLGFIDAKLPLPKIAEEHYTCCHCNIVFDGIGRQIGRGDVLVVCEYSSSLAAFNPSD